MSDTDAEALARAQRMDDETRALVEAWKSASAHSRHGEHVVFTQAVFKMDLDTFVDHINILRNALYVERREEDK